MSYVDLGLNSMAASLILSPPLLVFGSRDLPNGAPRRELLENSEEKQKA